MLQKTTHGYSGYMSKAAVPYPFVERETLLFIIGYYCQCIPYMKQLYGVRRELIRSFFWNRNRKPDYSKVFASTFNMQTRVWPVG